MEHADEMPEMPEQVLIKAAEVIRDKGFDAASVNDISRAVGITKGGLYYYIKGKKDLLYRIMLHGLKMVESWTLAVDGIEDPEEQLRTLIRFHIEAIARGRGAPTAVTEEVQALDEVHRAEILRLKRSYFDYIRGILVRLRNRGSMRDVDLSVATFNILGMVLHFARWYREGGALDPTAVADEMVDLAIRGLVIGDAKPAGADADTA